MDAEKAGESGHIVKRVLTIAAGPAMMDKCQGRIARSITRHSFSAAKIAGKKVEAFGPERRTRNRSLRRSFDVR
jgi:hypothetical protein